MAIPLVARRVTSSAINTSSVRCNGKKQTVPYHRQDDMMGSAVESAVRVRGELGRDKYTVRSIYPEDQQNLACESRMASYFYCCVDGLPLGYSPVGRSAAGRSAFRGGRAVHTGGMYHSAVVNAGILITSEPCIVKYTAATLLLCCNGHAWRNGALGTTAEVQNTLTHLIQDGEYCSEIKHVLFSWIIPAYTHHICSKPRF